MIIILKLGQAIIFIKKYPLYQFSKDLTLIITTYLTGLYPVK